MRTNSDSLGVVIDNSSSVNEFTVGHVTPVSISANQSLDGVVDIYSKGNLKLNNSGTLSATVTVKGDSFGSGTVGGKIEVKETMIFSGTLQQAPDHNGLEIIIDSEKTMTYTGSGFNISNHTLKLSGGGTFANTNNLIIDNAGSKLAISDSTKVSRVLVSASSTGCLLYTSPSPRDS